MLIAGAEVEGRVRDVRVDAGRIESVAARLPARHGEEVIEARGGLLLPGLHDHHLHLLALAAAEGSVPCGPPRVRDAAALGKALRGAAPVRGWVRGVGYHESVAGELDRRALDRWEPRRPVRVQHRSGALWVLNGAAVRALRLDEEVDEPGVERDGVGRATGRLLGLDAWLRRRLGSGPPPDLASASRRLARCGVTGVSDAGPANGREELALFSRARVEGALGQRLWLMGGPDLPEPSDGSGIGRGPLKQLLRDDALPPPEALARTIAAARVQGRAVAIHCVTRVQLVVALAAFERAGARAGDRVEHGSLVAPDLLGPLARLGLTVVTQPHFVRERGEVYLREVEAAERPGLYRGRSLRAAGIALAGGSDAPFGHPDPWRAMAAAVSRRTADGQALGPEEALTPEEALALFLGPPEAPGGPPRRVAQGMPADLCLLDAPWREVRGELSSERVRATWTAGLPLWSRDGRREASPGAGKELI